MKPEELRIGNTIYTKLGGGEWRPCNLDYKDLQFIIIPNQKVYKPIPVTEDWLIKFGWKEEYKTDEHKMQYSKKLVTGEILLHSDRLKKEIIFGMILLIPDCKIKYVHSLQNLFYDLTGKELAFKETKA